MKRYKLLKDLPTFKAGDLFYISEYGALVHNGGDPDGYNVMAYAQSTLEKFPNILTEWFEEIPNPTDSIHWKPKIGQRYFYIDDGYVFSDVWIDSRVDNRRYMAGAIYCAEADAKKALERPPRLCAIQTLSQIGAITIRISGQFITTIMIKSCWLKRLPFCNILRLFTSTHMTALKNPSKIIRKNG